MMNKGKTGNWLTDVFGLTHEASQRYRAALKLIDALPAGCRGKQPVSSDGFQAWQRSTVEERVKSVAEGPSGDRPRKLDPPLRPSLWRIRFSPDGRYVLAQDDGSIAVLDKAAAKVLFLIDAPDADAAQFTPDSESVVFNDSKLRVEKWNVATGQRTSVKELVVFDGCGQMLLSPDGKTLVCAKLNLDDLPRVGLRLIDVESGKPFYEKPGFWSMGAFAPERGLLVELEGLTGKNFASMAASPDGRYLVVAVGMTVLAYDLEHRQPVSLGGKLKGMGQSRMSFVGPEQLFVVGEPKSGGLWQASLLTFPEGRVVKEIEIGDQHVEGVTKGQALIMGPLKDYVDGILGLDDGQVRVASKISTMDEWDHWVTAEDPQGGLQIGQIGVPGATHIPLPLGPLPSPRAATYSPDGRYLAVSMRNRAAIWNLETGQQVGLMRPFRSVWMDRDDDLFGQFPKYTTNEAAELQISLNSMSARELAKLDDKEWQYHDLQLSFKPMGKEKSTISHATLEVKKMGTQAVAWSREYPHETPACWPAEDDRMVLAWDLSNDTAKAEIKNFAGLHSEAEALRNSKKGLLIETVVPETGAPLEQVIIPEADLSHGWDDARRAMVSGEFVLAHGEHSNTVIYRLDSGAKVGEFFGSPVATDAATGLIAAVNRDEEVLLVDERTGKELKRFALGAPVRLAQIVTGKEKMLLVLTADQVVHRLPLPE
jgi:hypothetical protein